MSLDKIKNMMQMLVPPQKNRVLVITEEKLALKKSIFKEKCMKKIVASFCFNLV